MRRTEDVSRETQDRLDIYLALLSRWNARIRLTGFNLSGDRDPVQESLALHRLIPGCPGTALDIGSGNGFPAIPLSIAFGIPFTLVECDHRKAAFLREVAREAACPVTLLVQRIEDAPVEAFDLITARAFGSLARLVALAHPRQKASTTCLFPKGAQAPAELDEARRDWSFHAVCHPTGHGNVVEISHIRRRT